MLWIICFDEGIIKSIAFQKYNLTRSEKTGDFVLVLKMYSSGKTDNYTKEMNYYNHIRSLICFSPLYSFPIFVSIEANTLPWLSVVVGRRRLP